MATNLQSIYNFRVITPDGKPVQKVDRFQSVAHAARLVHAGADVDKITLERRVNGQWVDDTEAYPLVGNHVAKLQAKGATPKAVKSQDTGVEAELRALAAILKVARQDITPIEIRQELINQCEKVVAAVENM
jgi:hypothetical protein